LSQLHSALSQQVSALSSQVSVVSVAVTSVDTRVNTVSNLVSALTSAHNILSNLVSNALSAGDVVSNQISALSAQVSTISSRVVYTSVLRATIANTQSVNTSTLANISGMVFTLSAGENWELEGMMLFSTSAAGAGFRLGLSVPPLSGARGAYIIHAGTSGNIQSATGVVAVGQMHVCATSTILSSTSTPAGTVFPVLIHGTMFVASAGTAQWSMGGIASTAQSPIHILAGSYLIARRLP
jgi:prefoldin subunit 5